jgi:hypothetical protein
MNATRAFALAYNERALIPTDHFDWDGDDSRLFRYAYNEQMYNNTIYNSINTFAAMLKAKTGIYKFTQGIYNPVYRRVEADVTKLFSGSIDFEDMSRGAIPFSVASDQVKEAAKQGFLWSNWGEEKSLLVRFASMLGDVAIKIVDEPDKEKVRMEVVHPGKINSAEFDAVGNVTACIIEYERCEADGKTEYTYKEIIDKNEFAFFKNGKPWDYINNVAGGVYARYPNIYGFVPLVIIKYKDMGQKWGASSFHAQIGKIHILNDEASLLHDQIRKVINLIWYFAGVRQKEEITASADERDKLPALYGPKESQPFPMVGQIDINAAGTNIERQILEIERDNPVLALPRLRDKGNLTAPGVRASFSDAIGEFTEAWGRLSSGMIRAIKMLITVGGLRGYQGFAGFNLESFDRGDIEIIMKDPEFVQDELSKKEKIDSLNQAQAPIWLVLQEMDYPQEIIDEVKAEKEKNLRDAMRGFAEGTFGDGEDTTDNGDTTDTEETPQKQTDQQTQADARPALAA